MNVVVSFSGGETSAFMAQWLWRHKSDDFNMVFVFANTGQENIETLDFVEQCSKHFGFHVYWVEAKVDPEKGNGTRHIEVDRYDANIMGKPFEQVIQKYGIPNVEFKHCTRELKEAPIRSFARDYFGTTDYLTAIGIRKDEFDRVNPKHKDMKLIYPLVQKEFMPATKPMINFYWHNMPFRLDLKGYQGNCKTCFKKVDSKLFQIAKENPEAFEFTKKMEQKYPYGINGEKVYFYRKNRSTDQILEQAKAWRGIVRDDSTQYDIQMQMEFEENESCEVFTEC